MPVSLISCHVDKETSNLCTLHVDRANGAASSYTLRWKVIMASTCGPLNVITQAQSAADPVPALWSTYSFQGETDTHSFCKELSVDRDPGSSSFFYVTANYAPAEPGELPDGGGTPIKAEANPVDRKPVFWWDREVTTRVETIDFGGDVIKTYANTLHDDLVEHERARGVLVAEFNLPSVTDFITYSRKFDQAVNYSPWNFRGGTIPSREAMVREISGGRTASEGSHTYCPVELRLAFADLGKKWDVPLPEMSQTHFSKTGGVFDLDDDGFRLRTDAGSLVPLNTDGTRRSDSLDVLVTQNRVRREVDFNDLNTILNRT